MPRRKLEHSRQALANETRRTKFERLGTARMNKALNSIRLLGNLAAPTYEWSPKDIDRIHDCLVECVTDTLNRFEQKNKTEKRTFSFSTQKNPKQHQNGKQPHLEAKEENDNRRTA